MSMVSSGIIKKQQVRLVDRAAEAPSAPTGLPLARVVSQSDGVAVIEVTCACGKCIKVECRLS